jgi:hypothetical protein
MCAYPNRHVARYWLAQLRAQGRPVRSIHPCFQEHPGCWHVTRQKGRGW